MKAGVRVGFEVPQIPTKFKHKNNQTRWSQHHDRPMMGAEMIAVMGIPTTAGLAEAAGVLKPDLSCLKNNATKAFSDFANI